MADLEDGEDDTSGRSAVEWEAVVFLVFRDRVDGAHETTIVTVQTKSMSEIRKANPDRSFDGENNLPVHRRTQVDHAAVGVQLQIPFTPRIGLVLAYGRRELGVPGGEFFLSGLLQPGGFEAGNVGIGDLNMLGTGDNRLVFGHDVAREIPTKQNRLEMKTKN